MSNKASINDFWYDQCKLICSWGSIIKTMTIKTHKINFFSLYQELFIIISNSIAIKYKNKLNTAILKHLKDGNDIEWKRCFKHQLKRNLFQIQAKCYFDYLTTAPHSDYCDHDSEPEEEKEKSKVFDWLDYKNNKHRDFKSAFKYDDFKQLLSDSDLCVLPFKLPSCGVVDRVQVRAEPVALICDIIKHDCVNMFKLYTKLEVENVENGYINIDKTIREMYCLKTSIYDDLDFTLFGASCYHGSVKIFNYLLKIMPNMEYCNQNSEQHGTTPLMVASEAHQVEIVKLLLPIVKNLGNDEISKTSCNEYDVETALHCALVEYLFDDDQQIEKKNASDIALLLIENGIDINIGSNFNCALHFACSGLYFDVIKKLVEHQNIKYNIDTCCCDFDPNDKDLIELEHLALYTLIKRVCIEHNNKSIMTQFKQLINFIIDYGTKTNQKNLENILVQTKDKNKNNITPLRYALHPLVATDVKRVFVLCFFFLFYLHMYCTCQLL